MLPGLTQLTETELRSNEAALGRNTLLQLASPENLLCKDGTAPCPPHSSLQGHSAVIKHEEPLNLLSLTCQHCATGQRLGGAQPVVAPWLGMPQLC